MAVTIDIAIPAKGDVEFDFTSSVITADNSIDSLTAQEITNAIRDTEEELRAMTFSKVADITGKADLGGSVETGIVVELLDGWKIASDKSSGTFVVQDGTVVETTAGTNIFDTNANVTLINLAQVGGVLVVSGSGVTAGDKTDIIEGVWDEARSSHKSSGSFGDHVRRIKNQKV